MSRLLTFTTAGLIIFSAGAFFIFELPWYYVLLADIVALILIGLIFRAAALSFYSNILYMTGKTDKAVIYFRKAIDAGSKEAIVYLNYAVILAREGRAREALVFLEQAGKLNKIPLAEKNIKLTTASCHWLLGDLDRAIEILADMRQNYDYVNAQVLITLGYLYLLKNNCEQALEATNAAIADAPASASAWDNLGQIYLKQEKRDEAKKAFLKALSFNAQLVDSLYFMGIIMKEEENFEEARIYFKKAAGCEISHLNTVTGEQIEEEIKRLDENLVR